MTITDQTAAETFLDDVHALESHAVDTVVAVRAGAAERILALEVTAARLAEERDRARQDVRAAQAATEALVADHLRRQTELEAERDTARRERNLAIGNARVSSEMTAAMSRKLAEATRESRGNADQVVRLVAENLQLRTENRGLEQLRQADAEAQERRRFPGVRRRGH